MGPFMMRAFVMGPLVMVPYVGVPMIQLRCRVGKEDRIIAHDMSSLYFLFK
jgi:hypothetical protein